MRKALSATAIVTVTVTAVQDDPVAADDSAETLENTAVDIDVLANDSDVDGDTLTVSDVTQGAGTVASMGRHGELSACRCLYRRRLL